MNFAILLNALLLTPWSDSASAQNYERQPIVVVPPPTAYLVPRRMLFAQRPAPARPASERVSQHTEPADYAPRLDRPEPFSPLVPVTPMANSWSLRAACPAPPSIVRPAYAPALVSTPYVDSQFGNSAYVRAPIFSSPQSSSARATAGLVNVRAYRPEYPVVGGSPTAYIVGQGLFGQPKVFIPGQPLRNMLRYLSP